MLLHKQQSLDGADAAARLMTAGEGPSAREDPRSLTNIRNPKPVTSELYIQMAESALGDLARDTSSTSSGRASPSVDEASRIAPDAPQTRSDKLAELGRENLLQIVTIYEEEVGMSYPVVDLQPLRNYIAVEYGQLRAERRLQVPQPTTPTDVKYRYEELLTAIIAIVMVLQAGGQSDVGARRIEEIAMAVRHRTACENPDVHDVILLILVVSIVPLVAAEWIIDISFQAFFYFHSDREVLAWRTTGAVVRMLQELGFHRTETLKARYPTSNELRQGVRLFWSVYSVERRFSFGSGLPFALQDADIDHDLPEPVSYSLFMVF